MTAHTTTPSDADETGASAAEADDLTELVGLLGETLAGLKRSGPPPPELVGAFERASLGPRHFPALLALTMTGPLSVTDLAKRLGHTLPTTSTIVGQLSRAGLLERAEDEADRRRTIVRLHSDYDGVIGEWVALALTPLRCTLERLPASARAQFMEGWRILHEEATRSAGVAGTEDC